ncbi:hypothetical protein D3879_25555 [Pseudomonas cavernicola]|uniref:Uncharacterized protein n=1 Tax=Pseudomonas cavernicola TaxID=2320866 RepID=A0A418X9J1_9PSED|nr:hypothetical protein [Pseudomonas cavernicola]RJG09165.1 hypothetical protein D3879_25555 [Pseudomonas cavernicola]
MAPVKLSLWRIAGSFRCYGRPCQAAQAAGILLCAGKPARGDGVSGELYLSDVLGAVEAMRPL